eukprot:9496435-Pyramimonas_sp.AAC.1
MAGWPPCQRNTWSGTHVMDTVRAEEAGMGCLRRRSAPEGCDKFDNTPADAGARRASSCDIVARICVASSVSGPSALGAGTTTCLRGMGSLSAPLGRPWLRGESARWWAVSPVASTAESRQRRAPSDRRLKR